MSVIIPLRAAPFYHPHLDPQEQFEQGKRLVKKFTRETISEGITLFRDALTLNPSPLLRAHILKELADAYQHIAMDSKAEEVLKDLVKFSPPEEIMKSYEYLIRLVSSRERESFRILYSESLQLLSEALKLPVYDEEVHFRLMSTAGRLSILRNNVTWEKAEAEWRLVIIPNFDRLKPDTQARLYNFLCYCVFHSGKPDYLEFALKCVETGLNIEGSSNETKACLYHYRYKVYTKKKDYLAAGFACREGLNCAPPGSPIQKKLEECKVIADQNSEKPECLIQ